MSFTAAILGSILVPAFGGTAQAHSPDGCIGLHVQAERLAHGDTLRDAAEFHRNLGDFEGGMGAFLDFLRAHCGR